MNAWWRRRVVFQDEPLREVAEQFNRLNDVRLQVDDDVAGALRLTGNLRGDDLASLRTFLDQQPLLHTRVVDRKIRVGSRSAAGAAQKPQ
jgi:transmembrane sensor